jgi:hypothetical protein
MGWWGAKSGLAETPDEARSREEWAGEDDFECEDSGGDRFGW